MAKWFAHKKYIFSSVVKHTSICIQLALVLDYKLELTQLDVKMVFLHRDVEDEMQITQSCSFKIVEEESSV